MTSTTSDAPEDTFITLTDGESNTLEVKGIPEMWAGNSYTFNLTVGKNTIQVASVTVQDWTGETLTGGQAEEVPVTTFSELQTALSAGMNFKLMNDIVCTAEIEITSGALTIDGNGKKLSTTSAIRAFKVESSATVVFKNLTLTGFVSGGGPAINNSGTIVLDGCTISNCHVNNSNGGGAIGINSGSEVRLINCSFSGNKYGTTTGTNDIGVYNKPTNYTIAGCTGATIASRNGDITTIATGTATLDYSDLSNISFTYTAE